MKLLGRQLYSELLKLFARKRTYLGFGAFLVVEILILLGLHLPAAQKGFNKAFRQNGLDFSHYYSGSTLAFVMLYGTVLVLGPLYLALVCGDIVSKEVEDGTMRMVLSRPISRLRVLLLKYLTSVLYTWTLTLFIVGSSLLLATLDKGMGGLLVAAPMEHVFGFFETAEGLQRFAISAALLCVLTLTLTNLAFMFSCFDLKPATATVMTLSVYWVGWIINKIPYFEDIQIFFPSHHMDQWVQAFNMTIPWSNLFFSTIYLGSFNVLFLMIGGIYFCHRDFKS